MLLGKTFHSLLVMVIIGTHTATQDLNMGNNSIVSAANGTFSNILSSATINGTTTVISPLFNGGKFNGESATILLAQLTVQQLLQVVL